MISPNTTSEPNEPAETIQPIPCGARSRGNHCS